MASIGVQVTGLTSTVRNLERMGVEVGDLRDAMGRLAEEVKPLYQGVTPVKSGTLRGDYRSSRAKGRANLYVGRASVPYAGPINYGWPKRNIRPANFVQRGDAIASPVAARSLEDAISDLVTKLNLG